MSDLELFPGDYSTSSDLVRLDLKSAVFKVKHMSFLSKYSRKQSHNRPAKKTTICCCVTTIEERISLFAVTMKVTIDPNVPLFNFG